MFRYVLCLFYTLPVILRFIFLQYSILSEFAFREYARHYSFRIYELIYFVEYYQYHPLLPCLHSTENALLIPPSTQPLCLLYHSSGCTLQYRFAVRPNPHLPSTPARWEVIPPPPPFSPWRRDGLAGRACIGVPGARSRPWWRPK